MRLNADFSFCAAHRLPYYDGNCNRTHGHNYRFQVVLEGTPDPKSGMIIDFADVDQIVKETVLDVVDHQHLNDFLDNPTAELIIMWFWELLTPRLPSLVEITLWELETASVTYRGEAHLGA